MGFTSGASFARDMRFAVGAGIARSTEFTKGKRASSSMRGLPTNLTAAAASSVATRSMAARSAFGVVGFCSLMALAAQCRFPVFGTDVPMTLQPLVMLLAGFALTPGCAAGAMLLYLAMGTIGAPVFVAGSLGIFGPTGGYLVGFLAGAGAASMLVGRRKSPARLIVAGLMAMAVLFAFGIGWRMIWFGGDLKIALATGFLPFVIKDMVQVALAVTLMRVLRGRADSAPGK